jgi:hypothetical protein
MGRIYASRLFIVTMALVLVLSLLFAGLQGGPPF